MLFNRELLFQRDSLIFVIIIIFFLGILAKAVHVQIIQSEFLVAEGNKRQIRTMTISAPRGEIIDRHGNLLALSTPFNSVWVDPKILSFYFDEKRQRQEKIEKQEKLTERQFKQWQANIQKNIVKYRQMLRLLNLSENTITKKILAKKKRRFMYLKRGVLPTVSEDIESLAVPGTYIKHQYKRYYPSSEINGHVIGFTNIDDIGISGIEKTYEDWLKGEEGKKRIIKDREGRVIEFVEDIKSANKGQSLTLSIDGDIQYLLYRALKEAYVKHLPLSAQSVILDAKTGEILAMASLPGFNPNNREQLTGARLRNRVVMDRIEPGSPIKPFIVAKALDLGLITAEEVINTNPGAIMVQGQRISDTRNHGDLTVAEILKKSSNVGISKIAFKLTPHQHWGMFKDIGFGQDLGLYLPGETLGFVKSPAQWQKIDQASASYGYGFNINLLQLAKAYTIFTNDGVLRPVSLLKIEQNKDQQLAEDERIEDADTEVKDKQVVSKEVANKVLAMLEAVAKKGGTAPEAGLDGYRVAGKTGTVHKTKVGGYEENQYLSLFVGIVPVSNPKYIMATLVNEPSRGVYFGGLVAAPIFKNVMEDVLRLKNIPPDKTGDER